MPDKLIIKKLTVASLQIITRCTLIIFDLDIYVFLSLDSDYPKQFASLTTNSQLKFRKYGLYFLGLSTEKVRWVRKNRAIISFSFLQNPLICRAFFLLVIFGGGGGELV